MKLEETLNALRDAEVEFVIIGGAAMQLQGSAYMTRDLEFCYHPSLDNSAALARAMSPFHPRLPCSDPSLPFVFDARTIERTVDFILDTDLGQLHFVDEVAGLGDFETVRSESDTLRIFGVDYLVLSLPGLIKAKRATGRAQDRSVVMELEGLLDLRNRTGI